ncbi:MAG: NAD(P)/FAD-dependent oxidoreductase [Ardenticatenales bacterium]
MPNEAFDAVIVGAGPNGLTAAVTLARAGRRVCVLEANQAIGGGARTATLTLPGFRHDICSAIHPMALLSPAFRALDLEALGVEWIWSPNAMAHPLDDRPAAVLARSIDETAASLGVDAAAYRRLLGPLAAESDALFDALLRPIRVPRRPALMARFGRTALRSAQGLAAARFSDAAAQALFAGCAAHSVMPLDRLGTASFGLVLLVAAHDVGWPLARGGSATITDALAALLVRLGGEIRTGQRVGSMRDLPDASAVLFDVTPRQLAAIAGDALPSRYVDRMRSFRYGPGVFKIDWALNGPVPWRDEACRRAATVHIGGTMAEIAHAEAEVAAGRHPDRPFVLFAQQSVFDPTRAPAGKHTGWAYCHVPSGSTLDMTAAIERQIERFAPGFSDLVLARSALTAAAHEAMNANMIGGDLGGGANDLWQTLLRPIPRWNPYTTPNPRLFLCSSSTPPGGGVHGMCGHWAAKTALARWPARRPRP